MTLCGLRQKRRCGAYAEDVPMQPRDYLDEPELFGDPNMESKPELKNSSEPITRHEAVAAELQASIAHTVKTQIKLRKLTQNGIAELAGMDYKRLYRLLSGKLWMKPADLVGLSDALSIDLVQAVEYKRDAVSGYRRFVDARRRALPDRFKQNPQARYAPEKPR